MKQPLSNVLVIDLTRWLAGPVCTMYLGDLGASVIKIETPGRGDDSREVGPHIQGESGYFLSVNRNKKSLTLNLKSEKGKEIFKQLVQRADVVVENFSPGTMEKFGLGYNVLREINPGIVYAACSGFGQDGPYAKKPAYDAMIQGYGGIMSITGQEGGGPTRVGVSVADLTAGFFMTMGILTALFHRERTGEGQMLDISLLDCQLALLENPIMRYFVTNQCPGPAGNRHPSIAPYSAFPTQDGYMIIAAGNDRQWERFCEVAGRKDLLEDPRFASNALRTQNYDVLEPIIIDILKGRTTADWIAALEEAGVPCGPINTIAQIVNDPQVAHRKMILEIEHKRAGRVKVAGNPLKFSATPVSVQLPPPVLGEHNEQILKELLGYPDEVISQLKQEKVI